MQTELKKNAVEFFQWFWNQPGTNAAQGYDEWLALKCNKDNPT